MCQIADLDIRNPVVSKTATVGELFENIREQLQTRSCLLTT
jgi:hypothetical protein